MNELHRAYNALGLEPGAPFETVKRRYRRLVLVWHPDRMTSAEAKHEAEEELKRINNQFEKLKKHFESDHKSGSSCRCQPAAAGPPPPGSQHTTGGRSGPKSSGPSEEQRKQEEESTRRRNAERERRAAEDAAARKAAEAAQKANEKQQAAEDAVNGEAARKDEALRWKCARIVGIVFIGLIAYCWLGCLGRDITHGIGRQWEDFQAWLSPKQQESPPTPQSQFPEPPIQPYIPPYERPPNGNIISWRQYIEDATQQNEDKRQKEREQEIYFAKLQIDRAQKAIDHCSHDIAQMELKLTDPFLSEIEKNKIREMRDFQQRNLEAAQEELQDAQSKLGQLDSVSPFGPPQEPPSNG